MSAIYVATPELEEQRLKAFGWPNTVSAGILDALKFRTFLDVGCGPAPAMAYHVVDSMLSEYLGVDSGVGEDGEPLAVKLQGYINQMNLDDMAAARHVDVMELSMDEKFDLVHTRFVLMHAAANRRADLIRRAIALANGSAIFLEYDWTPMLTAKGPETLVEFVGVASIFAGLTGMNLQMGVSLPNHFVGCEFQTEVVRFSRPKADYTSEMIQLCQVMRAVCSSKAWVLPANRARLVQESLEQQPIEFTPAGITAVIVRK